MPRWTVLQAVAFLTAITAFGAGSTNATASKTALDEDIKLSKAFGGYKGDAFSDIAGIRLGQNVSSISIRGDKRINAISINIGNPIEATWDHGGPEGTAVTLALEADEYICSMEIHWGRKNSNFRVFYLNFTTSANHSIASGTQTNKAETVMAPEGFKLSGFYGRADNEVDQLGIIWTRRSAKAAELRDVMERDWYGNRIRNWVGPTIGNPKDSACYRRTLPYNATGVCPAGYSTHDKAEGKCIAECPLSYPVSCFLECIPQNDNCFLEIAQKGVAVLAAIVNVATAGIFGAVLSFYQSRKREFFCSANIVGVLRSLTYYIRFRQTTAPHGTVEELLAVAYQSDVVLVDLPVAICHCLGYEVPATMVFSGIVMMIVEVIVKQAIVNGDQILFSAQNVFNLLYNVSAFNSPHSSVEELQDLMDTNSTCGYQLKRLTDHVIISVNTYRIKHPNATVNDIRVDLSRSSLVLQEIPAATNNCMDELLAYKTKQAAFETRDLLRKTFGVIVDQLVESAMTDKGNFVAESQFVLEATNIALTTLAGLDPTRIVWLASQFVQPTCGPTALIGEIDDGSLYDALGLKTIDEAFVGSYGTWTKKGDGMVNLIFTSIDTKDVSVVIYSGGHSLTEVRVEAGGMATWNSTVKELQDKTMYLDRWRPSFLNFPTKGGGSLKLWVPRASEGGHLTLHVRINVA
ncbi:putative jacalin-like lectin domain-containing protein [Plasmopara halstedii]